MISCPCPANAALTTIPAQGCAESFGQIQKVAFQRLKSGTTANGFTTTNSILLLASWTAKMAASDGTKIVVSPYIQAPTTDGGDARTFGGGNETLGGVGMVIGRNPTTFTGVLRAVQQSIIKAMKDLQCESIADNLGVYLFDENGRICCVQRSASPAVYEPIPIRALFIGDKKFGGLEAPDNNAISWSFLPNYSDDLAIVAPTDFNPLTDLVPASE